MEIRPAGRMDEYKEGEEEERGISASSVSTPLNRKLLASLGGRESVLSDRYICPLSCGGELCVDSNMSRGRLVGGCKAFREEEEDELEEAGAPGGTDASNRPLTILAA